MIFVVLVNFHIRFDRCYAFFLFNMIESSGVEMETKKKVRINSSGGQWIEKNVEISPFLIRANTEFEILLR